MRTALSALIIFLAGMSSSPAALAVETPHMAVPSVGASVPSTWLRADPPGEGLQPVEAAADGYLRRIDPTGDPARVELGHHYGWGSLYSSDSGFVLALRLGEGDEVEAGQIIAWVSDEERPGYHLLHQGRVVVPDVDIVWWNGFALAAHVMPRFQEMWKAAQADGMELTGWGYRSSSTQLWLRRAHCGALPWEVWQKPSGQCTPPTASPGRSMHEIGEAVDFAGVTSRDHPTFLWLAEHAAEYGFSNLPSEPWHWSTNGS